MGKFTIRGRQDRSNFLPLPTLTTFTTNSSYKHPTLTLTPQTKATSLPTPPINPPKARPTDRPFNINKPPTLVASFSTKNMKRVIHSIPQIKSGKSDEPVEKKRKTSISKSSEEQTSNTKLNKSEAYDQSKISPNQAKLDPAKLGDTQLKTFQKGKYNFKELGALELPHVRYQQHAILDRPTKSPKDPFPHVVANTCPELGALDLPHVCCQQHDILDRLTKSPKDPFHMLLLTHVQSWKLSNFHMLAVSNIPTQFTHREFLPPFYPILTIQQAI